MTKFIASFIVLGAVSTACASSSNYKMEGSRQVAKAETDSRESDSKVQKVERPESLKGDSPAYKRHQEFNKKIDRHYNR